MAGHQREKVIPDEVHQNQIFRELYLKELRTQKLYTQYHVNPLRKGENVTGPESPWGGTEEPGAAVVSAWVIGKARTRPVVPVPFHSLGIHDIEGPCPTSHTM